MKKLCSALLSFFMAAGLATAPVLAEETPIDVSVYGTVTDAGQVIDKLTIDFGDKKVSGVDKDTFTVHFVSTIDYGSNKGKVYNEKDIPIVKAEAQDNLVTLYFDQSATATLTWLAEGRNYPGVLSIDVKQNKPLTEIAPDGREVDLTATYSCSVTSYKDLIDPEITAYTDVQDEINYQFHKGTNDKLIVFFHGNGEGDFPVKDTNNNISQILANRGGAAWVTEAQEVFGDASVMAFQAPNMWYFAIKDNLLAPCYNEIQKVVEENGINPDEIYLSGASAGGFMCTRMIIAYPDLFKAAMINCPALDAANARSESDDAIPTDDELKQLLNAKTAIWLVQGETDSSVDPEYCSKRIWNILTEGQAVTSTKIAGDKGIASGFTTYETSDNKYKLSLYETFDLNTITGLSGAQRLGGKLKFAEDYDQDGTYTEVKYSDHWSWIYTLRNNPEAADGTHIWNWAVNYQKLQGSMIVNIVGDDWGPAVDKAIITLDETVKAEDLKAEDFKVTEVKEAFDWSKFEIITATTDRKVLDVYLSDAEGNKAEDAEGNIVTVEMYVSPNEGSPFFYELGTGFNRWVNQYELTVNGGEISVHQAFNFYNNDQWISQLADSFNQDVYTAPSGTPIVYGEYVPENVTEEMPLVIWLHGAGEGTNKGKNDNYIDLLGNEVTAFADEVFQKVFGGAYVITPQAPTMWMDDGTGAYQMGDKGSCYAEDLFEFIEWYARKHPEINKDRIIIGGCSNGGYMTMEMTLKHPGYFYKAYPICEAFADEYITDDMIKAVAEGGTKYWFTYALTDTTVNPDLCSKPTIERFKAAGIETHVSEWEKVEDLTGRFFQEDGTTPYEYSGHWSWIYFDNNANTEGDLNEWEWLAKYEGFTGFKVIENELYWFEDGVRQGTEADPKNISDTQYDQVPRGREIYDPETDAWYWLDADAEGKVARNKEVWMPYVYQDEEKGSTDGKWVRYDKYGQMIKGWYANDNGVYYYDLITGAMYKGMHEINGKTYTFDLVTGIRQ